MKISTREIRNRLLFLLMRAFVVALLLSLASLFAVFVYFIASPGIDNDPNSPTNVLVAYYLGHGSWDGVENVIALNDEFNSASFLLVDENNRIILNRLPDSATEPGSSYEPVSDDVVFDLTLDVKKIGALVAPSEVMFDRFIGMGVKHNF